MNLLLMKHLLRLQKKENSNKRKKIKEQKQQPLLFPKKSDEEILEDP